MKDNMTDEQKRQRKAELNAELLELREQARYASKDGKIAIASRRRAIVEKLEEMGFR
jgi:hypothetical protein